MLKVKLKLFDYLIKSLNISSLSSIELQLFLSDINDFKTKLDTQMFSRDIILELMTYAYSNKLDFNQVYYNSTTKINKLDDIELVKCLGLLDCKIIQNHSMDELNDKYFKFSKHKIKSINVRGEFILLELINTITPFDLKTFLFHQYGDHRVR